MSKCALITGGFGYLGGRIAVELANDPGWVVRLGSRKTQAQRRQRLRESGLTEAHLARLRGPIGLEIGAKTPEEIALAVMAEIVAAHNGQLQDQPN